MLPELLYQIPPDQEIGSVTADGAFDTRKCHESIGARGATAIIPPRKNAKPWKPETPGAIARNEALRASKRFGRTTWRRWSGYHRRSRVEIKMHCVKLLCQRLLARDFGRQVAEFQVRVAVLNGLTALGTPTTEIVGQVCPGKGEPPPSDHLCNRVCATGRECASPGRRRWQHFGSDLAKPAGRPRSPSTDVPTSIQRPKAPRAYGCVATLSH